MSSQDSRLQEAARGWSRTRNLSNTYVGHVYPEPTHRNKFGLLDSATLLRTTSRLEDVDRLVAAVAVALPGIDHLQSYCVEYRRTEWWRPKSTLLIRGMAEQFCYRVSQQDDHPCLWRERVPRMLLFGCYDILVWSLA